MHTLKPTRPNNKSKEYKPTLGLQINLERAAKHQPPMKTMGGVGYALHINPEFLNDK